jgi:hypothetical protein
MRHASWLKPMGLYAPEGRDVATRIRSMNDDPYKARCKPSKIESELQRESESRLEMNKEPKKTIGYNNTTSMKTLQLGNFTRKAMKTLGYNKPI